jgi:hypothetical protein
LTKARVQYAATTALATGSSGRFVRMGLVAIFSNSILCLGLAFFLVSSPSAYAANCTVPAPNLGRGNGDDLVWRYTGSPDCAGTYNLRWTVQVVGDSQIEISGSNHCHLLTESQGGGHLCVTQFKLDPGKNYAIKVQACDKRTFVESSSCSVWSNTLMLPFGPETCLVGFVWRAAVLNDRVCVSPETRQNTANDNAQAAARRNPNGGPFGRDTCREGFVWREVIPADHVCVTPATRQQARDDNAQASARVWRP